MKNYWDGYYKNKKNLLLPSNFAKFIKKKNISTKKKL